MKKKFTITCPPGSLFLVVALGVVYDLKVALETLAMLFVLGTIIENFL